MATASFSLSVTESSMPRSMGAADDTLQIITDFLKWVEQEKGLVLCEPYKPKYDWYTPVLFQPKHLAAAFLAARRIPKLIPAGC